VAGKPLGVFHVYVSYSIKFPRKTDEFLVVLTIFDVKLYHKCFITAIKAPEYDYISRQDVIKKLLKAIRKINPGAKMSDFWNM